MSPDDKIAVLRKVFADIAATGSVDGLLAILTDDVVTDARSAPARR